MEINTSSSTLPILNESEINNEINNDLHNELLTSRDINTSSLVTHNTSTRGILIYLY